MTSSVHPIRCGIAAARNPAELIRLMGEFRSRTLELVADLDDEQMIGPRLPTVNPPLWEIGHVAWFQEFWVLRHLRKQQPLIENGDRLYNSSDIPHDTRWELLLPSRAATLRYLDTVQSQCIERLHPNRDLSPEEFYFSVLAIFHEGMHAEALAYTRQTLAYPAPRLSQPGGGIETLPQPASLSGGDAEIAGGRVIIGATPDFPFVFDNEKWAHAVEVKPFRIGRAAVSNGEYLAFVEDGGYLRPNLWSRAGQRWLEHGGCPDLRQSLAGFWRDKSKSRDEVEPAPTEPIAHPVYWRRQPDGSWQQRVFESFAPLRHELPVVHISWYEAEAYCKWANRRLPTEAEWEVASSMEPSGNGKGLSSRRRQFPWGDQAAARAHANLDWSAGGVVETGAHAAGDSAFGCRQMIGNVWEWTADDFQPYPGFTVDPYKEYSKPWFGTHKVLRGGCWATSSLLIRNTWRNFYTPDRRDVWAGFRTCAL